MFAESTLRKVEIEVNGVWVPATLGHIEAGDKFRMFEPDGTSVVELDSGRSEFVAKFPASVVIDLAMKVAMVTTAHIHETGDTDDPA